MTLKSKITTSLTTYSSSSDLNKFGGRFKYSKVLNVIDNIDNSITSAYLAPSNWSESGVGVHGAINLGGSDLDYEAYVTNGLSDADDYSDTVGVAALISTDIDSDALDHVLYFRIGKKSSDGSQHFSLHMDFPSDPKHSV